VSWCPYLEEDTVIKFVSGGKDSLIKIWNYNNLTLLHTLEGHDNIIKSVCYMEENPNNQECLASADEVHKSTNY